jgi:OOP family OmpA-OmpF porin
VRFEPFVSLDPRMVERRAAGILKPPPGVALTFADSTLHAEGVAPFDWIQRARVLAPSLTGVERYDDAALRTRDPLAAVGAAASGLDAVAVRFARGETQPGPEELSGLSRAGQRVANAIDAAGAARVGACVDVVGHADMTGPAEENELLSSARASAVAADLVSRGVDRAYLRPRGAGAWSEAGRRARSVTFQLDVDEARRGAICGDTK